MFIGHFALGFAAKRAVPRASLALLFAGAQLADLMWPALLALGVEKVRIDPGNTAFTPLDFISYPYSHSLALLVVWGLALGGLAAVRLKADTTAFFIIAALVVSHWVLDWVTHRPDMPLYPGSPRYGLGLWNSVAATLVVELAMFAAGVWIYAASTRARDGVGRWAFIAFVSVLLVIYASNVASPPPPSVTAIWIVSITGGILLTLWSWWFDLHRSLKSQVARLKS